MKRWLWAPLAALLITAGCAHPNPGNSEVQAPPAATPTVAPAPAAPPLTPLPAEIVDYYSTGYNQARQPKLPLTDNACRTSATGTLQVQASEVMWRPHPLAPAKFWAPSAVITACNAGLTQAGEQSTSLLRAAGTPFGPFFFMPSLLPGQAMGPVRLHSSTGVPARAGAFWQQEGQLWPALTLQFAGQSFPVRRSLDAAGPEAPGGAEAPAAPTLVQLKALAWSSVTFSPDGKQKGELFLYDPQARYTLTDLPYCASVTGQVNADGQHWTVWVSMDGGAPVLAGDAGSWDFPGERGLYKETTTVGGSTYFYLEQYFGCANSRMDELFAYDQTTGTIRRPQMKLESGEIVSASGLVSSDGKLHQSYYDNAKEVGYHRINYTWDAHAKLWVFESHERPQGK